MDDTQHTIGLTDLLAEVDRDLDNLRRKHPSDYGVKNTGLWWELERERLMTRHGPAALVKRIHRVRGVRRLMILFFAGWATAVATSAVMRLLIP